MYSGFTPGNQQDVEQNHFLSLYNAGYRSLVPVIPPDAPLHPKSLYARLLSKGSDPRGKAPGIKTAEGWSGIKNWNTRETTQTDLLNWHAMGASTGIRTGDGLVLIDADTLNLEHAKTIRKTVEKHFGLLPCRIGREPKAGYPLRVDSPFPYHAVKFGPRNDKGLQDKVEILSDGRQFVAFGPHPATGKPYHWPRPLPPLNDLSIVSAGALHAFLDDLRATLPDTSIERAGSNEPPPNAASLQGDVETVRAAVELLPNTPAHFQSRESYIAVGQAIRGALPDHPNAGLEIFQDFAARWAPYAGGELDEHDLRDVAAVDWEKMHPSRSIGASWLVEQATKLTGMSPWFDIKAAHAESIREAQSNAGGVFPNAFLETSGAPRLALIPIEDLAARALEETAPPLVEGWLDQGAMSVLYGESNVGKSFVAMRLSWAVAAGEPVAGCSVTRGRVAYVVAEGGRGAAKRVAALRAKLGPGADGWFHLVVSPINLLDPKADLPVLVDRLRAVEGGVSLVVVDTLSRAMAGGDENASTDMGAMVKNLDALRSAVGCHLMMVHHSGKDRAKGARGHSLLRAATDTEIEVEAGRMVATKQRDIESRAAMAFVLSGVTVGADGSGRVVASAVAELRRAEREERPSEGASDLAIVDALRGREWRKRGNGDSYVGHAVAGVTGQHVEYDRRAIDARVEDLVRQGLLGVIVKRDETQPANRRPVPFIVVVSDKMSDLDPFA